MTPGTGSIGFRPLGNDDKLCPGRKKDSISESVRHSSSRKKGLLKEAKQPRFVCRTVAGAREAKLVACRHTLFCSSYYGAQQLLPVCSQCPLM